MAKNNKAVTNPINKEEIIEPLPKPIGLRADIADFFEQYPKAPSVLVVGYSLFLSSFQGEAVFVARLEGLEVETVLNPNV